MWMIWGPSIRPARVLVKSKNPTIFSIRTTTWWCSEGFLLNAYANKNTRAISWAWYFEPYFSSLWYALSVGHLSQPQKLRNKLLVSYLASLSNWLETLRCFCHRTFIYNICHFGFWGRLTSATSEGAQGFFFKNYIFEISASSWEKWAIAQLCSQNFH